MAITIRGVIGAAPLSTVTDYFAGRRMFIHRPEQPPIILKRVRGAAYCNSTRKKHCGAVLMLLVTAIVTPVPGRELPTGVQAGAARLVVHSS